jgi:hypothetical protein
MMKEVVNRQQDASKWDAAAPPELREHYRIVGAEAAAREQVLPMMMSAKGKNSYVELMMLAALAPRGLGLGAGDLMQEAAWPAAVIGTEEHLKRQAEDRKRLAQAAEGSSPLDRTTPGTPLAGSESWVPNWRQLGVGFGAGVLVTLLLSLQMRQLGKTKG